LILTVDIGTSSFKTALWTFEGTRIAGAAAPLSITVNDGLRHEVDPAQWPEAFENCCRRLGSLSAVEALVISGNGPSLAPVTGRADAAGGAAPPAAAARLWLDRRAEKAAAEVSALMGDYVDPGFFLPKALGIKNDEPALYERTLFFLGCPEYLTYALTGEARFVFPSEGFDRWYWNDEILRKLGLDAEKFPPFISPGETAGTVLPGAAGRFGFRAGIPVIAGGPDFFVSILGAGVVKPGQVCDRSGTSEGINLCTEKRITDKRLMSYGHPIKPYWNLSGIISTTGKAIEWGRDLLGLKSYDEFYSLAASAGGEASGNGFGIRASADTGLPAGNPGIRGPRRNVPVFLPYLAGERAPLWDPSVRGAFLGLGLSSGRAEFARSIIEGVCLAIRDVITVMEEAGAGVGELRVAGTAAESGVLNQIKADLTGREVLIPACREAELLGLALVGACALGKYNSFAEAASVLVKIEDRRYPDEKKAPLYDRLFREYRGAYRALKSMSPVGQPDTPL
jgi:xylulokinase